MIEFENTIRIERPIEEVFAFLADFRNVPKWNYYVREVTKMTHGTVGVGTVYHQVRQSDEQDYRVTDYEPPHKITVKTLPDSTPRFERRLTLQEENGGTHIVDEWALDTGMPQLIQKFASNKVKFGVADNLLKLKHLLETGRVVLQDGREVKL